MGNYKIHLVPVEIIVLVCAIDLETEGAGRDHNKRIYEKNNSKR